MPVAQCEEGWCIFNSALLALLCLFKKVKDKVVSLALPYLVFKLTCILMSRGDCYTLTNYSLQIYFM